MCITHFIYRYTILIYHKNDGRIIMSVSYEYYKIFYYVGKYHSFNKAASVLMNSQPNITRAMNNLESELDCKLFFRSHKGSGIPEATITKEQR